MEIASSKNNKEVEHMDQPFILSAPTSQFSRVVKKWKENNCGEISYSGYTLHGFFPSFLTMKNQRKRSDYSNLVT